MTLGIENVSIIKQVCIGVNRYSSQRGQAMYINCLESYLDDDNSFGEYSVQHRCSYDDFKHFEGVKNPSFHTPMLVTAEGKFEVFAGNKQFTVSRIVSVEPFKQLSKPATSSATK